MPAPRLNTCQDCRHFELDQQNPQRGMCHRHPPQVVGVLTVEPDPTHPGKVVQRLTTNTSFPIVFPTNWCGEFVMALQLGRSN